MYNRIYLPFRKRLMQGRRILILPHFRTGNMMIGQIFMKLLFPDIGCHNTVCNILHGLKIFIGKKAVCFHRNGPESIPAGQIGILKDLGPFQRILRGTYQIYLLLLQ